MAEGYRYPVTSFLRMLKSRAFYHGDVYGCLLSKFLDRGADGLALHSTSWPQKILMLQNSFCGCHPLRLQSIPCLGSWNECQLISLSRNVRMLPAVQVPWHQLNAQTSPSSWRWFPISRRQIQATNPNVYQWSWNPWRPSWPMESAVNRWKERRTHTCRIYRINIWTITTGLMACHWKIRPRVSVSIVGCNDGGIAMTCSISECKSMSKILLCSVCSEACGETASSSKSWFSACSACSKGKTSLTEICSALETLMVVSALLASASVASASKIGGFSSDWPTSPCSIPDVADIADTLMFDLRSRSALSGQWLPFGVTGFSDFVPLAIFLEMPFTSTDTLSICKDKCLKQSAHMS